MSDLSLVQWVASRGGVKPDSALAGELAELRQWNLRFRGRNSIVRDSGHSYDLLALSAHAEGYPVDESTFLDALGRDACAWAEGSVTRNRVYANHADFDAYADFWPDNDFVVEDEPESPPCAVCGALGCHSEPEPLCHDCTMWELRLTDPLSYEADCFDEVPLTELPADARTALVETLRISLDT